MKFSTFYSIILLFIYFNSIFTYNLENNINNDIDLDHNLEEERQWIEFKKKFKRSYETTEEEKMRKEMFLKNFHYIKNHNQNQNGFQLEINKFSDKKNEEFKFYDYNYNDKINVEYFNNINDDDLPDEIDWTKKGVVVTPVKDQLYCVSPYAFAAIGSIESAYASKTGNLIELSKQQIIDCSTKPGGNKGCHDGYIDKTFDYAIENGIASESSYPYKGRNGECSIENKTIITKIKTYLAVPEGDELALKKAVATIGPIATTVDSAFPFQSYDYGIYNNRGCVNYTQDHSVLIVGYGIDNGIPYWKVKNSWGADWGMDGYILMSRNKHNQCGIATRALYPVLD